MYHFILDGYKGYRSRFDDLKLIQELLDEVPYLLGLQPVMPSFLLPYYNGIVPEDCGISAFVFLRGGHMTIHTFSFRESYFADVLAPQDFDIDRLRSLLASALPCEETHVDFASREKNAFPKIEPDPEVDFGPHCLFEIEEYQGPDTLDSLFKLFDGLPGDIGMTPIMRPYVIRSSCPENGEILSAMTMIAESHLSLHIFLEQQRAYFDLFSCSFFDYPLVLARLNDLLPGEYNYSTLIPRGKNYRHYRTKRVEEQNKSRFWLKSLD